MPTNFLEKYSLLTQYRIERIEGIKRRDKQPDFIHMHSVNGREIAFLGDPPADPELFLRYYIRIDRMPIPQFAQMVNYEVLKETIKAEGMDNKVVSPTVEDLFYSTELDRDIFLEVAGMIRPFTETKRKFHHCDNYYPKVVKRTTESAKSWGRGGGNCYLSVLPSYFTDKKLLKYTLTLFYLSAEDIKNATVLQAKKYEEHHPGHGKESEPLLKKLKNFFEEQTIEGQEKPQGLDWDEVIGVFLIPNLGVDGSVVYQCILNVDGEKSANQAKSTKENLLEWIKAVEVMNDTTAEHELFVGVDDNFRCEVEEWSCTIAKDAYPVAGKREDMLLPLVFDSTIR